MAERAATMVVVKEEEARVWDRETCTIEAQAS
jgi:hypothetical protein